MVKPILQDKKLYCDMYYNRGATIWSNPYCEIVRYKKLYCNMYCNRGAMIWSIPYCDVRNCIVICIAIGVQ